MEKEVLVAIIGLVGVVIAAVIGALSQNPKLLSSLFKKRPQDGHSVVGRWRGVWKYLWPPVRNNPPDEIVVIESQDGMEVKGYITVDKEPDKRWRIEGRFDGRYLQLIYYHDSAAEDKHFHDLGCYFFEKQSDGSFEGMSIGIDWDRGKLEPATHSLHPIR